MARAFLHEPAPRRVGRRRPSLQPTHRLHRGRFGAHDNDMMYILICNKYHVAIFVQGEFEIPMFAQAKSSRADVNMLDHHPIVIVV